MNDIPFEKGDQANTGFQYFEDLSTAYWYSEILFTSIELGVFDYIAKNITTIDALASKLSCDTDNLLRLLKAMEGLALVYNENGEWFNSQQASRFLVSSGSQYMGHFILYRKFMRKQWQELLQKIVPEKYNSPGEDSDDVDERFFNYLRATDSQIKVKSCEIIELLNRYEWHFPVLDVGGGAGSLLREIIKSGIEKPENRKIEYSDESLLYELNDVINAAKKLYPDKLNWQHFKTAGGDFRSHEFKGNEKFGLIILSNFLHAYGADEASELLKKACSILNDDGIIIIHDYFPDRVARFPQKGRLYDLNMMINTYNGRCHESHEIIDWLKQEEMGPARVLDLKTDTSVIVAHGKGRALSDIMEVTSEALYEKVKYQAIEMGFERAVLLPASEIVTASWTRLKCMFGCEKYNTNLKCPPFGLDHNQTRELLSEYSYALILEGAPPGKEFHNKLLDLEKKAFLDGYYRSFSFIAGPCSMCLKCPEDGKCRNPKLARPSMEGSGIDVYATCNNAGLSISPVSKKGDYVKYIGLLLLG